MKYSQEEIDRDPRFIDIGNLPSNYFPYKFKKLYIRPFTVAELRLVSKAAALNEYVHLLRAVNLCISEDIMNITVGDFYYILMHMKIHSSPKTPYSIDWHCPANVIQLKTGKRLMNDGIDVVPEDKDSFVIVPCGTHNTELVHMSNVEILCLDEENFHGLPEPVNGVEFDFPRVQVMEEVKTAAKDPELKFIASSAWWLKGGLRKADAPADAPYSLEDKIRLLESQPDLTAFDVATVLEETVVHGIAESCTLTCRGCVKRYSHIFDLNPMSFFR